MRPIFSGLGRIASNVLDIAAWNGIQNFFPFCADMFIGHIFSAYLITGMYFLLFLGFAEKLLSAFVQFEKINLSKNVLRDTDSEMLTVINGADWICKKKILRTRIRTGRIFSNLEWIRIKISITFLECGTDRTVFRKCLIRVN